DRPRPKEKFFTQPKRRARYNSFPSVDRSKRSALALNGWRKGLFPKVPFPWSRFKARSVRAVWYASAFSRAVLRFAKHSFQLNRSAWRLRSARESSTKWMTPSVSCHAKIAARVTVGAARIADNMATKTIEDTRE